MLGGRGMVAFGEKKAYKGRPLNHSYIGLQL